MTVRALVCDDDLPIRAMLRKMLESRGIEVIEAKDGHEALKLFNQESIDFLVTDFLMPKMDGVRMIQTIRLIKDRGQMPIVLMSAISRGQIMREKVPLGSTYYINKPFNPKKINKLFDRIIKELSHHNSNKPIR